MLDMAQGGFRSLLHGVAPAGGRRLGGSSPPFRGPHHSQGRIRNAVLEVGAGATAAGQPFQGVAGWHVQDVGEAWRTAPVLTVDITLLYHIDWQLMQAPPRPPPLGASLIPIPIPAPERRPPISCCVRRVLRPDRPKQYTLQHTPLPTCRPQFWLHGRQALDWVACS